MRESALGSSATQRLYLEDAYLRDFSATVIGRVELGGRSAVLLDRSAFYPTGGGQPHDTGTLNGVFVQDVQESEEGPIHIMESPLASDQVRGELDWGRRFDHMQQHTGQHVLTQACIQLLGAATVGFHLGPMCCTIDLDRQDLTDASLDMVEQLANQVIAENRMVTSRMVAADDAARARVRGKAEQLSTIRLLEIEDFDLSGCGGTHVRCTAEIGVIKVLSVERHRGGSSRLTFLCGQRAIADYSRKHDLVRELVRSLTTSEDDIIDAVRTMEATQAQSRKREKQLQRALIEREACLLLSSARLVAQSMVVQAVYGEFPWDADSIRALAARIAQEPDAIALLGWSGEKSQLTFVRGPEAHGHMGELMKMACQELGGRGGGRPDWAQGGVSGGADLPGILEKVQSVLEEK